MGVKVEGGRGKGTQAGIKGTVVAGTKPSKGNIGCLAGANACE